MSTSQSYTVQNAPDNLLLTFMYAGTQSGGDPGFPGPNNSWCHVTSNSPLTIYCEPFANIRASPDANNSTISCQTNSDATMICTVNQQK